MFIPDYLNFHAEHADMCAVVTKGSTYRRDCHDY